MNKLLVKYGYEEPPKVKEVDRTRGVLAAVVYLANAGKLPQTVAQEALVDMTPTKQRWSK